MKTKIETVKAYFSLLEKFISETSAYASLLHPEMSATVFPNLITPQTVVHKLPEIGKGIEAGRGMLKEQYYEIGNTFEQGDALVVEAKWTGTMKISVGKLKENQLLIAHICFVFEFKEDKIFRQRNYDCYEPFS